MAGRHKGQARAWELGRKARERVPRARLGRWRAPSARPDPVASLIAQDAHGPEPLAALRYERMTASPFAFFRGAGALMAQDLATRENTDLRVQLIGDAQVANFGACKAPDGTVLFDVADFDDTLPGPFEWDVARLVTSFVVLAREKGLAGKVRSGLAESVAHSYRHAMREFASMSRMEVWCARFPAQSLLDRWAADPSADSLRVATFEKMLAKGRARAGAHPTSRFSRVGVDGGLALISVPGLIVPVGTKSGDAEVVAALVAQVPASVRRHVRKSYLSHLAAELRGLRKGYRLAETAWNLTGVGSLGAPSWIELLVSADDDKDDLVLQYRQAPPSPLAAGLPAAKSNDARRIVAGQRLTQAATDPLLGWAKAPTPDGGSRAFYVRQLPDWRFPGSLETRELPVLRVYAKICGWTLARAHARSGSPQMLAGYLGSGAAFEQAMVEFASAYADQNVADYQVFLAAWKDGRLPRPASPAASPVADLP